MTSPIQILSVEQDGQDGIIVKFSDTTKAGYVVEELLGLRPKRKWTSETPEISDTVEISTFS
jgi:hypothetical protein